MDNLQTQIGNLKTLQESYDAVAQAAEAYNTGKTELAANITAKGVEASASETLPELAEKVAQIAQDTIIYEGANSYGKQLSADGALWDLYQVLADMKTRFMGTGDYAALIVCEYYKGYDNLVLQGADGYYTCDGDYYDYANPTHVWHDDDNGKMNRWVAFLYRDEGARLDITNTSISPRSMYIGGHIGTIEYFVGGRLTDLVCGIEETDRLDNFLPKNFTQAWNKKINIITGEFSQNMVFSNVVFANIERTNTASKTINTNIDLRGIQYVNLKTRGTIYSSGNHTGLLFDDNIVGLNIEGNFKVSSGSTISSNSTNLNSLKFIHAKDIVGWLDLSDKRMPVLNDILVGSGCTYIQMFAWIPNYLSDPDEKNILVNNIKNHILANLEDRSALTPALLWNANTAVYDAIANEQIEWQGETMSLADAFLTKNWLLSGA